MSKRVIKKQAYVPKTIEVDGKIYEIAQRTGRTESRLKSWNDSKFGDSDIENFKTLFSIFLGDEAMEELMEDGEDSNIDYLDSILTAIYELYNEDKIKAENEALKAKMSQLTPVTDKISQLAPVINKLGK